MKDVVISGTGLYRPPHIITNAELVEAFNAYAALQNEKNAQRIAAGEVEPMVGSSVEFIEKASGIRQRYVIDKQGVLDPQRMRPHFEPRSDDQLSLMAEIAVEAGRQALQAAGMRAAQALAESYSAMVSGVLIGMSQALQQSPAPAKTTGSAGRKAK